MDDLYRKEIDERLTTVLRLAGSVRAANKVSKTSGKRIRIPLTERDNGTVVYKAASSGAPLIIGFHSGGWLFGGSALDDNMWKYISEELDVNVVSVGYRMAPEFKWRESLEDAYESAYYLLENGEGMGLDFDKENVALLGASAGGNLAAAVCLKSLSEGKMPFKRIFLFYPLLDVATEPAHKGSEFWGGHLAYIINLEHIDKNEALNPLASPLFADVSELCGFPDTYMFTAEFDVLKHEAETFAKNIRNAGGLCECEEMKGMSHCYFELAFRNNMTAFEKEFIGEEGAAAFEAGLMKPAAYGNVEYIKKIYERDAGF